MEATGRPHRRRPASSAFGFGRSAAISTRWSPTGRIVVKGLASSGKQSTENGSPATRRPDDSRSSPALTTSTVIHPPRPLEAGAVNKDPSRSPGQTAAQHAPIVRLTRRRLDRSGDNRWHVVSQRTIGVGVDEGLARGSPQRRRECPARRRLVERAHIGASAAPSVSDRPRGASAASRCEPDTSRPACCVGWACAARQ